MNLKRLNEKIDIPYIPEFAEYIAINFIISIVIKAASKKLDLASAVNKVKAPTQAEFDVFKNN